MNLSELTFALSPEITLLVGACVVLMIGHRPEDHELFYPESELARQYGAEAPEPTPDPKVAYSDVSRREEIERPEEWPVTSS